MKNKIKLLGVIAMVALIGFSMTDCGGDSDDGIVTPTVFDGYYGVTASGETVEVIITPPASSSIRAINWSVTNNYVIRLDGTEKSRGTVAKSGSTITFNASDGTVVTATEYNSSTETFKITVKKGDEVLFSVETMVTSADHYYALGALTTLSLAEIQRLIKGKTPEKLYEECWNNTNYFSYPSFSDGTFDELVVFAKNNGCPDSEISRVSKELNSGKISGFGYYKSPDYPSQYIMYFVSKLQLEY